MANSTSATDEVTVVRTESPLGVALQQPTILGDGTPVLSGPVPGGQVAHDATQAAARTSDPDPLLFQGVPGGMFTIYGADFGPVGMVHVGPTQVTVTSWQHYRIKGLLPPGLNTEQEITLTNGLGLVTKIPPTKRNGPLKAAPVTK